MTSYGPNRQGTQHYVGTVGRIPYLGRIGTVEFLGSSVWELRNGLAPHEEEEVGAP